MKKPLAFVLAVAILSAEVVSAQDWSTKTAQLQTRWAASVGPQNALPEYPRPQMVRSHWQNLNGLWHYAITSGGAETPSRYDGSILVPYPLESALSGVQKPLKPDQLLWYRRSITVQPNRDEGRTLLHFGAVDYQATVYLNGREIGTHNGGYQSFTFDITDALKPGDNELVVRVYDPSDTGPNPHGKQTLRPQRIRYTSSSGIWQTVWLETVAHTYIEGLIMTPDVDRSELHLSVQIARPKDGYTVEATARNGSSIVARSVVKGSARLRINRPHLWSPDDPFLYDLTVRVLKGRKVIDEVQSYFGLRKIEVKRDSAGIERIFLNNQYTYNLGTLDQGFWPEGIYTAPTDAALKFDIEAIKAMGFNSIRKHVKVEPDRWYYHCDKLGILVWQDMVPPANATPEARTQFEAEIKESLAQLHNHPSITTWVLFNEAWGAYDQERLGQWMKQLDPSRLMNSHSGPLKESKGSDWVASDMTDVHNYPDPKLPPAETGKARVLGEYGGVGVFVDGHIWNDDGWGYAHVTSDQMTKTYADMVDKLKSFEAQGLSGSIYTQPFDVETEQNGLMTYDRAVIKIPLETLNEINRKLIPSSKNRLAFKPKLSVVEAIPLPTGE